MRVALWHWLVQPSSDSLSEAGGSTSRMVHLHDCWQETSVPHHVGISVKLNVLVIWQLISPRAGDPREQGGSCNGFHDLSSKVTLCHSTVYWLHRSVLFSVGGNYPKVWIPEGREYWGPSWSLGSGLYPLSDALCPWKVAHVYSYIVSSACFYPVAFWGSKASLYFIL